MKRTPIRRVSSKMVKQQHLENILKAELGEKYGRWCHFCGSTQMPRDKHEIVLRSQGGDPTEEDNCLLLCRSCHDRAHRRNGGLISRDVLWETVRKR